MIIKHLSKLSHKYSPNRKELLIASILIFILLIVLEWIIYKFLLIPYLHSIYNSPSLSDIKLQLKHFLDIRTDDHTLDYYLLRARIYLTRLSLLLIFAELLCVAFLYRLHISKRFNNFFKADDSPFNLAIFRIVLFFTILHFFNIDEIVRYSNLPKELIFPPIGYGLFIHLIPLDTEVIKYSCYIFIIFCFMSLIGLFTRVSIIFTLILGVYLLGIPNLFGKVNHTFHHLIWFTAILSASRCSDVLSIDSIISSYQNAKNGIIISTKPSNIYALPIRFIWLLFGIIYFFPGFWKIYQNGIDWIITDNLKYLMYDKWFDYNGWTPFFRIDQYPYIIKAAALSIILFEISFIFIIFIPRIRFISVFGGIAFHNLTNIFMRISFKQLQYCYVVFFDWANIFKRIGEIVFRSKSLLIFNQDDYYARIYISILNTIDMFGNIDYEKLTNINKEKHAYFYDDISEISKDNNIILESDSKLYAGSSAALRLLIRIPLLWMLIPIVFIFSIIHRLRHYETKLADNINIGKKFKKTNVFNFRPLILIGSFLIIINSIFGFLYILSSWPFSTMPSFRHLITEPTSILLTIQTEDDTGKNKIIDINKLNKYYGAARLKSTMNLVIKSGDPSKLIAIWNTLKKENPDLDKSINVYFYKDTISTIPSKSGYKLLKREILYKIDSS